MDVDGEIGFVVFTVNWRELRFHVGVSRIGDMTLKGISHGALDQLMHNWPLWS